MSRMVDNSFRYRYLNIIENKKRIDGNGEVRSRHLIPGLHRDSVFVFLVVSIGMISSVRSIVRLYLSSF